MTYQIDAYFQGNNYADDIVQNQQVAEYQAQVEAAERRLTYEDALNVANAARLYPTISPELAVGMGEARIPWDDPLLSELVMADASAQDEAWSGLKGVVRNTFNALDSWWEEGIPRFTRSAVRMYQGEAPVDAWRNAGGSTLAMQTAANQLGLDTTIGQGWLPGPTNYGRTPEFRKGFDEGKAAGLPYEQRMQQGHVTARNELGLDIVTQQKQRAEETQIHRTIDGVTYASPVSLGRLGAIQIAQPDTLPFDLISGSIDAATRIGLDPVNTPADEFTDWLKARRTLVPDNVAIETGLFNRMRPWVQPTRVNDYLTSGRGQRIINYVAGEKSVSRIHDWMPHLPGTDIARLADANNAADVIDILRPHLGVTLRQAPRTGPLRALGATIYSDDAKGIRGGLNTLRDGRVNSYLKRVFAEAEGSITVLDPTDTWDAMDKIKNFMRTYKADTADIDRVLKVVARRSGSLQALRQARAMIRDNFTKVMKGQGVDDVVLAKMLDQFDAEQLLAQRYFDDVTGNAIREFGEDPFKLYHSDGRVTELTTQRAQLESQFAAQNVGLPSIRELRRGTAGFRQVTNKLRNKNVLGLEASRLQTVFDYYTQGWRTFTLLRGGWMFRVLPDEIARTFASGYGTLGDTASWIAMSLSKADAQDLLGGDLDSWFKIKGLGAGNLEDIDAQPFRSLKGTEFDRTKTEWVMAYADSNPTAHAHGVASDLAQLWGAESTTVIIREGGVEGAFKFFRETEEGKAMLRDIANRASSESNWRRAVESDRFLRIKLQSIDAHMAMSAGGDILLREMDSTGKIGPWRTGTGHVVEDFSGWSHKKLDTELRNRQIAGRASQQGRRTTKAEKIRMLQMDEYGVDFASFGRGDQFIVLNHGSEQVRNFIATGQDAAGNQRMWGQMNQNEMRQFVDEMGDLWDEGFTPPEAIRTPKQKNDPARAKRFTDRMFYWLGQAPTNQIVRSPFAQARYFDEVGRLYVYSDDATRAQIRKLAEEHGDAAMLNRGVQRTLDETGMGALPKNAEGIGLTIEEIDELAKYLAVDQTKELFYDLASKSNAADMLKHIFPFADAWWEILSTWGRLINPYKTGGQAIRNVRRGQQAIESARTSGWFQEDEFGNEVFAWYPGFGQLMQPLMPDGVNLTSMASLEQQLFLDIGNPRTVLSPGVGPMFQVPAAMMAPRLPGPLSDFTQWFTFGDFPATDTEDPTNAVLSQAPTWIKRLLQAVNPQLKREQYANDMVLAFESFINANDPRYGMDTEDQRARTTEAARDYGTMLSIARIFDAWFLPASPRYQTEFMSEAIEDGENTEFYVNMASFAREFGAARQHLGEEEAVRYMWDTFGADPFNSYGITRQVKGRPVTEEAYAYLEANPGLAHHMDLTMMAWVPDVEGDLFSQEAWAAAKKPDVSGEISRESLNVEQVSRIINQNQANRKYHQIGDIYDAAVRESEIRYGRGTPQHRIYVESLDEWRRNEVSSISSQHLGWEPGADIYGVVERPSNGQLLNELREIATPGTSANAFAQDLNPELLDFVTHLTTLWDQLEDTSRAEGFSENWWRISTSQTNPLVERRRQWFEQGLQWKVDQLSDPVAVSGAGWIAERILTFLIEGYELDDPMLIEPTEPPAPGQADVSDILRAGAA